MSSCKMFASESLEAESFIYDKKNPNPLKMLLKQFRVFLTNSKVESPKLGLKSEFRTWSFL